MKTQRAKLWDDAYRGYPAWYELDTQDLTQFIRQCRLPLDRCERVLDLGSGYGKRIIDAVLALPEWNHERLQVTCVDISPRAIDSGRDRWASIKQTHIAGKAAPKCAIEFRVADVTSLPDDIVSAQWDIVIDWMLLHGLPASLQGAYTAQLQTIDTECLLLKCFTAEHGSLSELPETIPGVAKSQFSDAQIATLLGPNYAQATTIMDWPEDVKPEGHSDGPIAAKRAYCFPRQSRKGERAWRLVDRARIAETV
ncbi:MAG: class I SAM-dependent methyltransferase [Phycisphaeraceae bacterium]|nr:class I SAM-dependent methyltransferase [Phycisphaeraceae bacterium]